MSNPAYSLLKGDPTTWGVPPVGKTFMGINLTGQLALVQSDGTISTFTSSVPAFLAVGNAAGTTTITPAQPVQTTILTITGGARAVPIVLSVTGQLAGAVLDLLVNVGATAGYALDIRNATGGGIQLDTYTSNGATAVAKWRFVFDGAQWNKVEVIIPAY